MNRLAGSEPSNNSNLYYLLTSNLSNLKSSNTLESVYPRPAVRGVYKNLSGGGAQLT